MSDRASLPLDFLSSLADLEGAYLASSDPIKQSGFGGGAHRWRLEREPILNAVDRDGDFLDIGCANGFLVECLVRWALERGYSLIPWGLDAGPRLVALAKQRQPHFASNFWVANAWAWRPQRRFRFVYSLIDCVPMDYARSYVQRLMEHAVEQGGRLIIGAYGSRSRRIEPQPVEEIITAAGLKVLGTAVGGDPVTARFAWSARS